MSQSLSPQLAQQLNVAFRAIQEGRAADALKVVKRLQRKLPKQADVLHLAALTYKSLGDVVAAEQHFLRCVSVAPNNPQVLNNLANLQKSLGRFSEAEQNYDKAIRLKSDYVEAIRNLAICQQAQDKFDEAIQTLESSLAHQVADASSYTALADCYRQTKSYAKAQQFYEKAIDVDPGAANALHNLGLNFHLQGELDSARQYYRRAQDVNPKHPTMTLSYVNSIHEAGEGELAIEKLRSAVSEQPLNIQFHERLNELLWEAGDTEQFGDSYSQVLAQNPNQQSLFMAYARQMFRAGRTSALKEIVKGGEAYFSEVPEFLSLKGELLAEQGEYESAKPLLMRALDAEFSKQAAQQLVKLQLIQADYLGAQSVLDELKQKDPDCQLTWALQSLIWRDVDKDKYRWLCDYDSMVKAYTMPVPDGYADLAEFVAALEVTLLELHNTEQAPLDQTLREGTQTAARLLHNPNPVIQAFKKLLSSVVIDYIGAMPNDSEHPLFARKKQTFEFSGSWSVNLRANGFHVNHVHPAGWISSSCYITLPAQMESDDVAGSIKFGESPLVLSDRERIEKIVRPRAGMVVLFPSYFWHGTIPFSGAENDFRLTAPFDVVPR